MTSIKFPHYKQQGMMDCGPACLRIICKYYGRVLSERYLRILCSTSYTGSSLQNISEAAQKIGFATRGVRLDYECLIKLSPLPCIVHWKKYHFVVVYKVEHDKIYVSDPAQGLISYTKENFLNGWAVTSNEGIALILRKTSKFKDYELQGSYKTGMLNFIFWFLGKR